ncbi:TetR/AcrR family transcriptional regulator [Luteibacter sp. PPL201]|uniref:TetR/AcrR family transcriptional regulator n=1 Tax=Luteibacter sahnii TaxID=3021977 RepID=A0ABT6BC68_9GAMM|nr:TetR/AcrR family transcriptional regulator [Luteibacter sp. PPL193]MDY1547695.1 TetR/AcrR family transcriptional regulator [Luteibacter sp. PPL193]
MTKEPLDDRGTRAPQQERGRKRREAILDAAAALISEGGADSVTMQAVAQRASSSVGSMYHFFRNREQLLDALAQRHADALEDILKQCDGVSKAAWRAMPAHDMVQAIFGEPLHYFARHPDALITLRVHDQEGPDRFQLLLTDVMAARIGTVRGKKVAEVLYAVASGTLLFAKDRKHLNAQHVLKTIPAVLLAYLESIEPRASDS